MDTKQKINIPLPNEVVKNQILQGLHEFSVLQLHVLPAIEMGYAEVFIIMSDKKDAEILRVRPWIGKAAAQHQVNVHISYSQKAEFQLKRGNPFYQYYADPSTLVWMNEDPAEPLKTHATKKAFKKKLNVFKEQYYHDHDILLTEAKKFYSHQMYIAAFQSYLTVFEHHAEYLEDLYTGCINSDKNLHQRLKELIRYLPEIQKIFVMKNKETFYLISKMEESAEAYDDCFVSSELFDAVKTAEMQLYKMVADRFLEFSSLIRFKNLPCALIPSADDAITKDTRLEKAIASIAERLNPEEIYLFHKKDSFFQNEAEQRAVYYFFVIGDGIGNTPICDTQQSVYDQSGGTVNVVILGHRRFSIQDRLFDSHDFVRAIMTPQHLVYAAHSHFPTIHWRQWSSGDYGDLSLY